MHFPTQNPENPADYIWNTFTCSENTVYLWQNGTLKVWFKRTNNDWLIASKTSPAHEDLTILTELEKEPEQIEWSRWSLGNDANQITFSQEMTDRPLLVKTLITSHLPPGTSATFYTSIPLAVKISIVQKNKTTELLRLNSLQLSNTWFGDNFAGELCYAFKTKALREHQHATKAPYRAICPVMIQNDANLALPIQRICIRVKNLNIYKGAQHFWTNRVNVNFRGNGLPSRLEYEKSAPEELKDAVLVKKAEEVPENKFLSTLGHSFLNIF